MSIRTTTQERAKLMSGHDLNVSEGVHMCQELRQASNASLEACSLVSIVPE